VTRRILFITATRIGDAVLSTGLLSKLARDNPDARFTVACGPIPAPLFEPAPFVERVIPMPKRRRAGHWIDLWKKTVLTPWSMVVDLRGSGLSYVLPTLRRHVVKSSWEPKLRLYHIASACGLTEPQAPELWSTPEQDRIARALMPEGPILALGPSANWGGKQWPAQRFAQVALALTAPDGPLAHAKVAVLAAPAEAAQAQPVLDAIPEDRRIDLIGKVDLPTLYACLKRASLYVGNDSGLMHMAAASGIPTLGLFGPSSEIFYGPWGPQCASVRGPRSFEDICHAPDFDYKSHDCLMLDLDADKVISAATDLVKRTARAS
jgi:ADP-heptose:LPS heptosyltransferase